MSNIVIYDTQQASVILHTDRATHVKTTLISANENTHENTLVLQLISGSDETRIEVELVARNRTLWFKANGGVMYGDIQFCSPEESEFTWFRVLKGTRYTLRCANGTCHAVAAKKEANAADSKETKSNQQLIIQLFVQPVAEPRLARNERAAAAAAAAETMSEPRPTTQAVPPKRHYRKSAAKRSAMVAKTTLTQPSAKVAQTKGAAKGPVWRSASSAMPPGTMAASAYSSAEATYSLAEVPQYRSVTAIGHSIGEVCMGEVEHASEETAVASAVDDHHPEREPPTPAPAGTTGAVAIVSEQQTTGLATYAVDLPCEAIDSFPSLEIRANLRFMNLN